MFERSDRVGMASGSSSSGGETAELRFPQSGPRKDNTFKPTMPKPASLLSLAFLAACMAVEKPRLPPPPAAAPAAGEFVDDPHSGNGYNLDDYAALTGRAVPGFREPPLLAERVARGELPPVSERLPDNPLVIVPWEEIGSYGGTLRYAATGFVGDTYLRYFNETQLLEIKPEPGTSPSAAAAHAGDGVPGTRGLGAVVHLHARAPLGGGGVRAGQGPRRRELPGSRSPRTGRGGSPTSTRAAGGWRSSCRARFPTSRASACAPPRRRAADPHPPLPVGADRVGQRRRDGPGILERPRHRRHRQVLRPGRPAAGGQRGSPSTW